jgi:hypothetical protein
MEQKYFNTKEAVKYLRIIGLKFSPSTFEVWRSLGKGPRFTKVTSKVYYEKSALDDFAKGERSETIDSINGYISSPSATRRKTSKVRSNDKKIRKTKKPKRIKLQIKSD